MNVILKKLFGVRDKLARDRGFHDREMPFLEHLEELRITLMRIIVTLVVFTIGCFIFARPLMELMRHPVAMAGLGAEVDFPDDLDKKEWRRCEQLAKLVVSLPENVRTAYLKRALPGDEEAKLMPYIRAMSYFQATLALTDKNAREPWVIETLADDPDLQAVVLDLVRRNRDARVDRQGNLIAMSALRPAEGFTLSLKLSLFAGIILSFPLIMFFIAQFVFPGLTLREKKVIMPNIGIGFGLLLTGAVFAYYVVTPRALSFFHQYNQNLGIDSDWRIGEYITFVTQLVLVFGLSFELPVIVMALVKLELLSYEFMKNNRSYAIVILVVVGAIITPTGDALTLSFLAGPLILLYEMCIWMAFFMRRKERKREAAEEAAASLDRPEGAVPARLPLGTVGKSGATPDSERFPLEENDAYAKPADEGDDEGEGSNDENDHPVYEEGFEPKTPPVEDREPPETSLEDDDHDAGEDPRTSPSEQAEPSGGDEPAAGPGTGPQEVDESRSSRQKDATPDEESSPEARDEDDDRNGNPA